MIEYIRDIRGRIIQVEKKQWKKNPKKIIVTRSFVDDDLYYYAWEEKRKLN